MSDEPDLSVSVVGGRWFCATHGWHHYTLSLVLQSPDDGVYCLKCLAALLGKNFNRMTPDPDEMLEKQEAQ